MVGPDGTWTFGKTVSIFFKLCFVNCISVASCLADLRVMSTFKFTMINVFGLSNSRFISGKPFSHIYCKNNLKNCPNSAYCLDSQNVHAVI